MQLPQLQTGNLDVSNSLFRLAENEQRRRMEQEQAAMNQMRAENMLLEKSILMDKQRSMPQVQKQANALAEHEANAQRAQQANEAYKYLKSSIRTVKQEDYPKYKESLESLGIVPGSLPSGFGSESDFNKWKEVTADVIDKSAKGTKFIYERVVNEKTGEEMSLPFEEGEVVSLDKYFSPSQRKDWKVKGKGDKAPEEFNPVKAEEAIFMNADQGPEILIPRISEFNSKSSKPYYLGYTEEKKGWNPLAEPTLKLTRMSLPSISGKQITGKDVQELADKTGVTWDIALQVIKTAKENMDKKRKQSPKNKPSTTLETPRSSVTLENVK